MDNKGIAFLSAIPVRAKASDKSEMTSQILFGESYQILGEEGNWYNIKMDYDGYEGFIDKGQFQELDSENRKEFHIQKTFLITHNVKISIEEFGLLSLSPGSEVPLSWMNNDLKFMRSKSFDGYDPDQIIRDAEKFLGSPYLWGGRTIFGLDCSGLVQIVFKLSGIKLKRDASLQIESGEEIKSFSDHKKGDLAFFANDKGKIHHVGIISEKNMIIHSSSWVRENELNENGILNDNGEISHHLHSIRRLS